MDAYRAKISVFFLLVLFTFAALATATNIPRRQLGNKKYKGPCRAENAIDKCWRCDPNWAENRQKMADCALGFGSNAIGGKLGRIYVVTDPSDDDVVDPKPGTLRYGVIQKEPLWIIFGKNMKIKLSRELIVTSNKTIDGRGFNVHIQNGAGIKIQCASNIIISNLRIHNIVPTPGGLLRESEDHVGLRSGDEGDGISIFDSRDIWIDHISMSRATDGLIDAVAASTNITISNCHFTDHEKVMLFGANDNYVLDKDMKITLAYNHFGKRLDQRMPRCRFGFFHLVNNDYTHWERYAIGGSSGATIISQGNRFIAEDELLVKEVTYREKLTASVAEWMKWTWISDGDDMENGATFTPSGDQNLLDKIDHLNLIKPEPSSKVGILTKFSGALSCVKGRPC
ncbi:pectate lyase-like [Nicotiana tabacum]|uniref:Pectate lyase n=2 Tax=Nicotiana tabacum TaxID=4097 RepID=A0A1S3ZXS4_TOBAC|nr:pectate lyase [Nicotiana tomentosiformis]XP_016469148.1 PREDICTED: pectate lyase-like [Nicotiana tabacum]